jgi:hypothetical protein
MTIFIVDLWVNISRELWKMSAYDQGVDKSIHQLQSSLFSQSTGLISGTTAILYGWICNCLVAVHAVPTETPLCYANRRKDFPGGFSNRRPVSSSFSSVQTRFLCNGFPSIKMPWVRTFFTNLETVSLDWCVQRGNLRRNFLLHDLYEFFPSRIKS